MSETLWLGNVIVYRNLAYVPTMQRLSSGGWYTGEPVMVLPVTVQDVARGIEKARRAGNPPTTPAAVALSADPILRSTGAITWGRLALYAVSYEITWRSDGVTLVMSKLDERGRFMPDPARERRWPTEVNGTVLAEAIVADWQARLADANSRGPT